MPGPARPDQRFHDLVLQLRARMGVTQRELAGRLGVHVHTLQAWESSVSYPGAASLRALIEAGLAGGGFTAGQEQADAESLWSAALRDAPRFRTAFDGVWFTTMLAGRAEARATPAVPPLALDTARPDTLHMRRQHWGDAPDVVAFLGRASERLLVQTWVQEQGARVVAIQGLGGIGKTLLVTRLAQDLAPGFERVYWRSLRDAPSPAEWLTGAIAFLAAEDAPPPRGEAAQIRRLLELLTETRCLLILDNFETVLQPGERTGQYRPGYQTYGDLLRRLGEVPHQSCLALTTREEPPELSVLRSEQGPVRTLDLGGLGLEDGRALLRDKRLTGDDAAWGELIARYGGNGLALKMIGETIRELFGGSIAAYLEDIPAPQGVMMGGVRQLLAAQLQRLSGPEHDVLRWLAVQREPVAFMELAADLGPLLGRGTALEAVERLRRRSLLERGERRSTFTLHSVVLEYVTEGLIEELAQELTSGRLVRLAQTPLVKATAREFVRRSQERLIAEPLIERLAAGLGSRAAAERQVLDLLATLRAEPLAAHGYAPGTLVNLLRLLRGNLRGIDLSGLAIRQAYFQEVDAQDASLVDARLSESVFAEAFNSTTAVALSADGAYLAAGTSTGEVRLWRVADRTVLATVPGHTGAVWGVALSSDGALIASSSEDGTVRLWDAERRMQTAALTGHTAGVWSVALSGDGRLVASASWDGTVRLWEAASGRLLSTLTGHTGGVRGVALSEDGALVVSGGYDGTVRLWDVQTGRPLRTLQGHTGAVWSVAISGDGHIIASGSYDQTVRLWNARSGAQTAILHGHTGGVRGLALSGDGRLVASGSFDGFVRLWQTETGRLFRILEGHTAGVWGVALDRGGAVVASGSFDGTAKLWEADTGRLLATLQGDSGLVYGVALDGAGRLLASGSVDGTVKLWDADRGALLRTLTGHSGGVPGVAMSRDGLLVASGSWDGTVRLWDTASGRTRITLGGHTGGVWGVALSGDGRLVASGDIDGTVRVWETATGRPVSALSGQAAGGHTGGVWGVALSGDGRMLASGSLDQTARLWETSSGRLLGTLEGHSGGVRGVALSADGGLLASGSFDGAVKLWDTASGQLRQTLTGHASGVWGVALSEDGQTVISGSFDGTARVWDVQAGRLQAILQGHTGGVWGVALRRDQQMAASGSVDGSVRVWDTATATCLRALQADRRYERLDITGMTGVTAAQRDALLALGATEQRRSRAATSLA